MEEKIFESIDIRGMHLKNRVVLPAMGTKFVNGSEVSDELIHYHVNRVKGGCGLNIVEVASVHSPSAPQGFLSISDDKYIPGLKKLCDAIHENGGKAGIQLWQGSLAVSRDKEAKVLVASDLMLKSGYQLKAITKEEIYDVIDCYGKAAKRAVEAGFDCVEIHMGHNYLLHSFLSGGINKRNDEFGGNFENRIKVPLMVIDEVRKNVPSDFPVFVRIDAHDDYLENGLTIDEVINFLKLAKEHGVDVADISRGNIISNGLKYEVPPVDIKHGFNIENAHHIKEATNLIIMGVGRINHPEDANEIMNKGLVDLIGIGRAQLADPNFVNKMKNHQYDDINYCVGCNQGCYDGFENVNCPHISCLRNPALGLIEELCLPHAQKTKKVLVAGGGIAGMLASMICSLRGHDVTIAELAGHLGGQFLVAGVAPRKDDMSYAMEKMAKQVEKMDIKVQLNTEVNNQYLEKNKFDVIIDAIGSSPIIPNVEGVDKDNVYTSHEVLNNKIKLDGDVCVIGGGLVGIEIAEYESDSAKNVKVLEMQDEICKGLGRTRKISVMESIAENNINIITSVKVNKIKDKFIEATKGDDTIEVAYDNIVLALGAKSNDDMEIEAYCDDHDIELHKIGDINKVGKAIDATREAYEVAIKI